MDEDRFKYKYVFEVIDDGTAVLSVSEPDKVTVTAKDDGETAVIKIADNHQGAPYTGEYDVIPKVEDQYLETSGRHLSKDVHVYKIPYYKTSNESGGMTVSIAS